MKIKSSLLSIWKTRKSIIEDLDKIIAQIKASKKLNSISDALYLSVNLKVSSSIEQAKTIISLAEKYKINCREIKDKLKGYESLVLKVKEILEENNIKGIGFTINSLVGKYGQAYLSITKERNRDSLQIQLSPLPGVRKKWDNNLKQEAKQARKKILELLEKE